MDKYQLKQYVSQKLTILKGKGSIEEHIQLLCSIIDNIGGLGGGADNTYQKITLAETPRDLNADDANALIIVLDGGDINLDVPNPFGDNKVSFGIVNFQWSSLNTATLPIAILQMGIIFKRLKVLFGEILHFKVVDLFGSNIPFLLTPYYNPSNGDLDQLESYNYHFQNDLVETVCVGIFDFNDLNRLPAENVVTFELMNELNNQQFKYVSKVILKRRFVDDNNEFYSPSLYVGTRNLKPIVLFSDAYTKTVVKQLVTNNYPVVAPVIVTTDNNKQYTPIQPNSYYSNIIIDFGIDDLGEPILNPKDFISGVFAVYVEYSKINDDIQLGFGDANYPPYELRDQTLTCSNTLGINDIANPDNIVYEPDFATLKAYLSSHGETFEKGFLELGEFTTTTDSTINSQNGIYNIIQNGNPQVHKYVPLNAGWFNYYAEPAYIGVETIHYKLFYKRKQLSTNIGTITINVTA